MQSRQCTALVRQDMGTLHPFVIQRTAQWAFIAVRFGVVLRLNTTLARRKYPRCTARDRLLLLGRTDRL